MRKVGREKREARVHRNRMADTTNALMKKGGEEEYDENMRLTTGRKLRFLS